MAKLLFPLNPPRPLHLTSPLAKGPDVRNLQKAVNLWCHPRGLPIVTVDGQFGPLTAHAAGATAYSEGLYDRSCSKSTIRLILHPWLRSPAQRSRAKKRAAAAKKHGQGIDGLLKWAGAQINIAEHPPGSNGGEPEPAGWIRNLGFTPGTSATNKGPSWCGIFVGNGILHAGGHVDNARIAYTPDIETDGKVGANGFVSFTAVLAEAKRGDVATFDWTGRKAFPEHTGILESIDLHGGDGGGTVTCIEGNTGGSNPSDGGMVARVTRPFSEVVGFSRVRF